MTNNPKRNPEDNTDSETARTTSHLGVGPETGLHPTDPTPDPQPDSTVTPEEPHQTEDEPIDVDPNASTNRWLNVVLVIILAIVILYFIFR